MDVLEEAGGKNGGGGDTFPNKFFWLFRAIDITELVCLCGLFTGMDEDNNLLLLLFILLLLLPPGWIIVLLYGLLALLLWKDPYVEVVVVVVFVGRIELELGLLLLGG